MAALQRVDALILGGNDVMCDAVDVDDKEERNGVNPFNQCGGVRSWRW